MRVALTFAFLVGLTVLVALVVLGARLSSRNPTPQLRRAARLAGAVLLLGGLCFVYAYFVEARWLEVTHQTIETAKWPRGKRLRVALVSDLHVEHDDPVLRALPAEVATAKADLVVFTGDSLNALGGLERFREVLGGLEARLGRVAVRGNHDTFRWGAVQLFPGVATELAGGRPLRFEAEGLTLCGALSIARPTSAPVSSSRRRPT